MHLNDKPCPVGEVFGKWTILKEVEPQYRGKVRTRRIRRVLVTCSCGSGEKEADLKDIRLGKSSSCGCARWDKIVKHNDSKTPLYKQYTNMKQRSRKRKLSGDDCNIFPDWLQKGGKGFLAFKKWSLESGYVEGTSYLCRNGDKGDYAPDNCRWGTSQENTEEAHAKRYLVKRLEDSEWKEIYNLAKFSRENNLNAGTMHDVRLGRMKHHKGWMCKDLEEKDGK